jgi:hypothetical protein
MVPDSKLPGGAPQRQERRIDLDVLRTAMSADRLLRGLTQEH